MLSKQIILFGLLCVAQALTYHASCDPPHRHDIIRTAVDEASEMIDNAQQKAGAQPKDYLTRAAMVPFFGYNENDAAKKAQVEGVLDSR